MPDKRSNTNTLISADKIRDLQRNLTEAGLYEGNITGKLNRDTLAAVEAYERSRKQESPITIKRFTIDDDLMQALDIKNSGKEKKLEEVRDKKRKTTKQLSLDELSTQLSGRLIHTDTRRGEAGLSIDFWIAGDRLRATHLGKTNTGKDGSFSLMVEHSHINKRRSNLTPILIGQLSSKGKPVEVTNYSLDISGSQMVFLTSVAPNLQSPAITPRSSRIQQAVPRPEQPEKILTVGRLLRGNSDSPLVGFTVQVFDDTTKPNPEKFTETASNKLGLFEFSYPIHSAVSTKERKPSLGQNRPRRLTFRILNPEAQEIYKIKKTLQPFSGTVLELRVPAKSIPTSPSPTLKQVLRTSKIRAPNRFLKYLADLGVETLSDIDRKGGLGNLNPPGGTSSKAVAVLSAHVSLTKLSTDLATNAVLISVGYTHPLEIANASLSTFVTETYKELGDFRAAQIHQEAVVQVKFLTNTVTAIATQQANGYSLGMHQLLGNKGFPPPCQCRDCEAAVSPLAYLVDLLEYALKHLRQPGGGQVNLAYLTEAFKQPWSDLPASCAAAETDLRQARIGIEVLRKHYETLRPNLPQEKKDNYDRDENRYLRGVYDGLLQQLGTSSQEIRLARSISDEERTRLASKLGFSLVTNNEFDRLLLTQTTGAPVLQLLSERNLEILFGLVDTSRDELSSGAKLGDPQGQLMRWNLAGVEWIKNTDQNGRVYIALHSTGPLQYRVRVSEIRIKLKLLRRV